MKFKSNSNTNFLTDETLDVKIIDSYALLVGSKKNVLVIGKNDNLNKILKKNSCNVTEVGFNSNNLEVKKIERDKLHDSTLDFVDLQKLENKKFADRAPADIIIHERQKQQNYEDDLAKLQQNLKSLTN